ncbi:MAG: hypothetical protein LC798_11130 [Chloroflexi bacterium]|nr:hypothetical protein [Chloroflexota bacterium]
MLSPVVEVTEVDDETGWVSPPIRKPKVATLVDPGTGRPYPHSSAIDTPDWALSFVRAQDFGPLDADPQCINIIEQDYNDGDDLLAATPRDLNWPAAHRQRVLRRLTDRDVDVTGLTIDSPLWQWLERLGRKVLPSFTPRGTWVR